jgi:hypothetical protein
MEGIESMKSNAWSAAVFVVLLSAMPLLWCGCRGRGETAITFGARDRVNGLKRINNGDGKSVLTNYFGSPCRLLEERPETYLYLQVDPEFNKHTPMMVTVTVECLAARPGTFDVQYDGGTPYNPNTASPDSVVLSGSGEWQKETFELSDARFQNRQNGQADFRLRVNCPEFYVRRVEVAKSK